MNEIIKSLCSQYEKELINVRRHLHKYPELGDKEFETKKYIIEFLKENNILYNELLDTAIHAYIENGNGENLAFRADMDALELNEENDLEFKSKNKGIMHACGHDVHMSVHLLLLKILNDNKKLWKGKINIFFQPAEETRGGAKRMIEKGVTKDIDNIFAFHCAPELESGTIGIKYGKLHATSSVFKMKIIGKETHAALAYQGIDSIVVASKVVDYLQTIVSRRIDARDCAVITVGTFNAGTAENIVASEANLTGTIRTLTKDTKKYILNILENDLKSLVSSYGAKLELEIIDSYAPVINNDEMTRFLEFNAVDILGKENVKYINETRMDVEDMGFFLEKIPGSFYRLGVSKMGDKNNELHTKNFYVDEKALKVALMLELKLSLEIFNEIIEKKSLI